MTLLPLGVQSWRKVCALIHRILVRPRYYIGRRESGELEEILVYRGDVYLHEEGGEWHVELRGISGRASYVLRQRP